MQYDPASRFFEVHDGTLPHVDVRHSSGIRQVVPADRVRYLEHLGQVRDAARAAAAAQGRRDAWSHPHPAALWQLSDDPARLWERRQIDEDFTRLTDALPYARFVVVEPFWYTDRRPASVAVIAAVCHENRRSRDLLPEPGRSRG